MFNTGNCASVPLVANIDGNGNNNGWGAEGSWLWFIIVIFAIFGWGGFGNGFGGNGMNGGVGSEIQRGFDNQAVVSKLDGISNGLCDGFYAMNNSMLTGFNGINTNIMQTGYGIQQAINALQNTMNNNTRDIIDSQQAGTRAILDFLTNDKIATLQAENNDLRRAASQDRQNALLTSTMAAQTNQIINAVNPAPIPAYTVPNPNAYYGCGCNTGCNC